MGAVGPASDSEVTTSTEFPWEAITKGKDGQGTLCCSLEAKSRQYKYK